ncbi:putative ABC transporter ATP-binding protein YxlF [Streptomyces xanthophaeus]|uniref:ABC transporter ATP-binding protein n=1 Tax=Streptomyces xanthophaeus TaxID=67385 RepID=UPI00233ECD21|nr:ATP-binding cassette domain-containing protein [Streptomyces xanthophaeus]WCD87185.1 putative ABC transporter ATP-binding protein YxlF [Streptomyces xanthophaeus]
MEEEKYVVSVRGLRKEFRGTRAVDGVSFDVARGRITGFLGPNGAGKTTTLRMLLGLTRPSEGTAHLWGRPYRELAAPTRRVGVALDGAAFVAGRTGRNHLSCYAQAAGCDAERIGRLLADVGLEGAADRPVGGYSTGMKQRLALAAALLGDPELLILDEPSNGLDPEGMVWLREFLRGFAASGRTVLLSSHLLGEMEQTVDDVLLMHHGRLLCSEPLSGLLETDGRLESAFMRLTHARNGATV